jgi:hypothetical protein
MLVHFSVGGRNYNDTHRTKHTDMQTWAFRRLGLFEAMHMSIMINGEIKREAHRQVDSCVISQSRVGVPSDH